MVERSYADLETYRLSLFAHEELEEGDGRRGIQTYNRRVAQDPRLVSHILPVGGWLAVSVKVG